MKKLTNKRILGILCATLWIYSCSSNTNTQEETIPEPKGQTDVQDIYVLASENVSIKWTAYKFTEKAGVNGTFDSVSFQLVNDKGTLKELFQNAEFTIKTRSVNTNMPLRDDRIYNSLFVTVGAEAITGRFAEVLDADGQVVLQLGEHSGQAPFSYTLSGDTVTINTSIDLEAWDAHAGVDALHEACKVEHTGTDGVSKMWPDVDIEVKVPVRKVSDPL